ncbi:MAG: glycosyltransferase family 39 protein [Bacteroidia bacterium]
MSFEKRLLVFAALFIIACDLFYSHFKVMYGGDEIISYLCATGNSVNYEEVLHGQFPYGKISDAAEWKKYFEINEPHSYLKIASDLCVNDLHPPLYFWLLHLFVLGFGVHIFTGILLNLVLQLFTFFFVYKLAFYFFNDHHRSVIAALVWAISPACAAVAFNARPYELLQLLSAAYLLNFLYWLKKPGRLKVILLVAIGTTGLLTHYSFLYVIASCGIFFVFKLKNAGLRNFIVFVIAAVLAFATMTLIHPCWGDSFLTQHLRKESFSPEQVPFRITKVIIGLVNFFLPVMSFKNLHHFLSPSYLSIAIIFFFAIIGIAIYLWKELRNSVKSILSAAVFSDAMLMLIILAVTTISPYLFFLTHEHAMGGQYLVFLYPMLAIVVIEFLKSCTKKVQLFFIFTLAFGCFFDWSVVYLNQQKDKILIEKIENNKMIIVNNMERRAFPRFIPYLKPGQKILMDENAICQNNSLIKDLLNHKPFLFISTRDKRKGLGSYGIGNFENFETTDGIEFYVSEVKP